jgi:SAM-dependent methyltransferase
MEPLDFGSEAMVLLTERFRVRTILDIGAGVGAHARFFRDRGHDVTTISWSDPPEFTSDMLGDYTRTEFEEPYDAIWASHVLEHQRDPGAFLRKLFRDLKAGGVAAITVPPAKQQIVGGHLTIWNAGLLLYNMIMAGFDCRDASVKTYGYNVSVIVRKRLARLPSDLVMNRGDIERLSRFFPFEARQAFNGQIPEMKWDSRPVDVRPPAGSAYDHDTLSIHKLRDMASPFERDLDLLLWAMECREIEGHVLEFGVFRGKSITALAESDPLQQIHGFDSFEGLPEDWVRSPSSTYPRGHFRVETLPVLPTNARLVKGRFDETLPSWRTRTPGPISLIHLDGDLYSSALEPLCILNDRILRGTMIVFDELCDWSDSGIYPEWPQHEWRALLTWMHRFGRKVRPLGRGPRFNGAFVVEA